jgi:transcriptional regulator with XRE-family HTH domain
MAISVRQQRFGAELRDWRSRRRISQLDLAIRAGTTQRHLSYIEQGRSAPGRTMVVRLAESLELSLRERNNLLVAAGYAPLYCESDFAGPLLEPARDALMSILAGHEPYPAIIVRGHGDVMAVNSAFDVLAEDVDPALLQAPVNGYRLALHPDGMAPRIHNFPAWAQHVIEALRGAARRSPDPALDQLLAELDTYVPPTPAGPDYLGFAVPLELRCRDGDLTLITTLMSFATAVDLTLAELHLEAFLPGNPETSHILRSRQASRSVVRPEGPQS